MTDNRNEALNNRRKELARQRSKIRAMLQAHPEAFQAIRKEYHHTAEELAKAGDNEVRVMIGHNQVIEALLNINAMEIDNEISSDE